MNPAFQILLVEDDPGHALLLRRSLERAGLRNPIVGFDDGESLLEHLDREPGSADHRRLLLLDLRLPDMGGIEVLQRLGERGLLEHVPTVVLTTSALDEERRLCESLGCTGFLTKPVEVAELRRVMHRAGLRPLEDAPREEPRRDGSLGRSNGG